MFKKLQKITDKIIETIYEAGQQRELVPIPVRVDEEYPEKTEETENYNDDDFCL